MWRRSKNVVQKSQVVFFAVKKYWHKHGLQKGDLLKIYTDHQCQLRVLHKKRCRRENDHEQKRGIEAAATAATTIPNGSGDVDAFNGGRQRSSAPLEVVGDGDRGDVHEMEPVETRGADPHPCC